MSKVLSCFWNIHINGSLINSKRKQCIESIDFEELCDGSDLCTIVIHDTDYVFIEDNIFVEEATVSVNIGWHGDTHTHTFTGYISAIDLDFPESGYPVMTISCLDKSHLMNRKKKNRSWDNLTRADVVKKIAQEYGFKCVVEKGYSFKTQDTITQSDATDIEFCESLAGEEREPFMCKLIKDTVYYVKKGVLSKPVASLYYRESPYDIQSFKPQITKEIIKEEVESADINTNDKTIDSAKASHNDTDRETQGDPVVTTSNVAPKRVKVYDQETGKWDSKEVTQ